MAGTISTTLISAYTSNAFEPDSGIRWTNGQCGGSGGMVCGRNRLLHADGSPRRLDQRSQRRLERWRGQVSIPCKARAPYLNAGLNPQSQSDRRTNIATARPLNSEPDRDAKPMPDALPPPRIGAMLRQHGTRARHAMDHLGANRDIGCGCGGTEPAGGEGQRAVVEKVILSTCHHKFRRCNPGKYQSRKIMHLCRRRASSNSSSRLCCFRAPGH